MNGWGLISHEPTKEPGRSSTRKRDPSAPGSNAGMEKAAAFFCERITKTLAAPLRPSLLPGRPSISLNFAFGSPPPSFSALRLADSDACPMETPPDRRKEPCCRTKTSGERDFALSRTCWCRKTAGQQCAAITAIACAEIRPSKPHSCVRSSGKTHPNTSLRNAAGSSWTKSFSFLSSLLNRACVAEAPAHLMAVRCISPPALVLLKTCLS